ncbi:ribonuclease H-like domain-containing protein [Tanacetum coccineum]
MTPTKPPSYQFLNDNLDPCPIALRLLTTHTSPQQTLPQTANTQTTPQTIPPTSLSTPSPQTTPVTPLLYVEDIILTASSTAFMQRIISSLHAEFTMTYLGPLNYFLGCPATRRSTFGYCVYLGDNLLTWSSKRQDTLSCSSAEAEYCRVANAVAETSWIRNLLRELHNPLFTATLVYCDNVSVVYMSANPVQHQHTKHIEIDIHFVRDKVAAGHV